MNEGKEIVEENGVEEKFNIGIEKYDRIYENYEEEQRILKKIEPY